MLFQDYKLLDDRNLFENVALPLHVLGYSAGEIPERVEETLELVRQKLKDRAPKNSIFNPPYSTLQIGGVFGGIAHNVIADKCYINWETLRTSITIICMSMVEKCYLN